MQLNKKISTTPKTYDNAPKEYKKGTKVDWKVYKEDLDAILSYGKYSGKTLGDVMKYDSKYYDWLHQQELLGDWGLVCKKALPNQQIPHYDEDSWYTTASGEVWVGLRQVDSPGKPSQYL